MQQNLARIFVKLSFRKFCNSKLSGLHPSDNDHNSLSLKQFRNRKLGCEFKRHQSLK